MGIFLTQGSTPGLLLRCTQILYRLSHQGSLNSLPTATLLFIYWIPSYLDKRGVFCGTCPTEAGRRWGPGKQALCHMAPCVPPAGGPVVLWVLCSHNSLGTAPFTMLSNLLDDVVVGPGHDGEFPTKNLEIRKTATVRDETQSMAIATARSRPISEAKQGWAWLVLGWERWDTDTSFERQGTTRLAVSSLSKWLALGCPIWWPHVAV